MIQLKKGLLISIEGIDGSGKSTLAHYLKKALTNLELPVVLTKEPGGSALGQQLRDILQTQPVPLCAKAEYLLFAANRAQHFHEIVIPSLQQHRIVISDRMADSSIVYQGYGRGLDIAMINTINDWAMQGVHPDLTFYISIPLAIAKERITQRKTLTVFEKMAYLSKNKNFIKKQIAGFDALYKDKKHVIVLDGTQQPQILTDHATKTIMQWIQQHNK